jgi:hypothetical protein
MSLVKSNYYPNNDKTKRSDSNGKQKSWDKTLIRNTFRKAFQFDSTAKRSKYSGLNSNYDEGSYELVHYVQPTYEDMILKQQKILAAKFLPNKDQYNVSDPKVKFSDIKINLKLNDMMTDLFKSKCPKYSADAAKVACQLLSEKAKNLAKSLKLNRYRFVVDVFAAQKAGQSIMMASRCLCADTTDYYVSEIFDAEDYIVSCTIYGLYKV